MVIRDSSITRLPANSLGATAKPGAVYLIANNDRLVTRQELMDTVWGDTVISESALTKAVARLRKALGDDSATHRYIETVRSQGYRFVATCENIFNNNNRYFSKKPIAYVAKGGRSTLYLLEHFDLTGKLGLGSLSHVHRLHQLRQHF